MDRRPDTPEDYLRPPHDSFWAWEEGGEAACFSDGVTIAFRAELQHVLDRHLPRGLPPLGAVLLLLAAMREREGEADHIREVLTRVIRHFDDGMTHLELLEAVQEQLSRISRFAVDVRAPLLAKMELIDMALEECRDRTSPAVAAEVVKHLQHPLAESLSEAVPLPLVSQWWHLGPTTLLRDLKHLQQGLPRVEEDALRLRIRTGLECVIQTPDDDLAPADKIRALVSDLQDDDQLGGMARLAHDLMAAVTLPRRVSQPDELPLGGVSDIANRGPLDRLLLSELAHDDLTLAVRVAVGEALYLRREAPPRTPPHTRTLLLDAGLRTWGVPRIYIAAVALAMAATTDRRDEIVAWRANGETLQPVELTQREGLLAHLETLTPDIHPGASLDALLSQLLALPDGGEAVLITTADTLADREFQIQLGRCDLASLFVASVDRQGTFQLLHYSGRGKKVLREAQIDLDQVLAPRKKSSSLIDRDVPEDLPAIFSVQPFPLLLSHPIDERRMWMLTTTARESIFMAVTRDRRLRAWTRPGYGARQIADDVPPGVPHWHTIWHSEWPTYAIISPPNGQQLTLLEIYADHCLAKPLPNPVRGLRAVASHNGAVMVISKQGVEVFAEGQTEVQQRLGLPGNVVWVRDRFFQHRQTGEWLALAYDGVQVQLEAVLSGKTGLRCPKLAGLFDRTGHDGPWGVTIKGDLYDTATDQVHTVKSISASQVELLAVHPDGDRVIVRPAPPVETPYRHQWMIDVNACAAGRVYYNADTGLFAPQMYRHVRQRSLRSRISGVFEDNGLVLISQKGSCHRLKFFRNCIQLQYVSKAASVPQVRFTECSVPEGMGIKLQRAELADGAEVFIDSRGLLHLRDADRKLPEVTLVLDENHISGWSNAGGVWGEKYYTGREKDSLPEGTCREFLKRYVMGLA